MTEWKFGGGDTYVPAVATIKNNGWNIQDNYELSDFNTHMNPTLYDLNDESLMEMKDSYKSNMDVYGGALSNIFERGGSYEIDGKVYYGEPKIFGVEYNYLDNDKIYHEGNILFYCQWDENSFNGFCYTKLNKIIVGYIEE